MSLTAARADAAPGSRGSPPPRTPGRRRRAFGIDIGFEWTVPPMPSGGGEQGLAQGVVPQTPSVAEDSEHPRAALDVIAFLTRPEHAVHLARGDGTRPTSRTAQADPALHTTDDGWHVGAELAEQPRPSPVLGVRGYPEWRDKVATPALQQNDAGALDLAGLREELAEDGNRILNRYRR